MNETTSFGRAAGVALAIAERIPDASSGDRAAFRRGEQGAAFWRLWHALDMDNVLGGPDRWSAFMQAVAILSGASGRRVQAKGASLGGALQKAGVSEAALNRLLSAPFEQRQSQLLRLVRRLANEGVSCDAVELMAMIVMDDPDITKRKIARTYFSSENRNMKGEAQE